MNDDDKRLGELMKATIVAVCRFRAHDSTSTVASDAMLLDAESVQAYPMSSKRRLYAVRAELDATVRNLRRQVSLGNWSRHNYERLVDHLRAEGLIDISTWIDSGAERMKKILEKGELRTLGELRFVEEYRDFADPELQKRIDDLITSFRVPRRGACSKKPSRLRPGSGHSRATSRLSSDDLKFVELAKRTAATAFEHAAGRETRANIKQALENRAEIWRTIEFGGFRNLREFERAFWVSMSELRHHQLTESEFRDLAAKFKEEGLIDISPAIEAPVSTI